MRAPRARATGALALAALLTFVIGVPLALGALGAGLPTALPSLPSAGGVWAALSAPDDGTIALGAVVVAAWAAWAFFTLAVAVEVIWRVRGLRAPRLPGLGVAQASARRAVGVAALLFLAVPVAAQAASVAPPAVLAAAGPVAAAPAAPGGALGDLPAADPAPSEATAPAPAAAAPSPPAASAPESAGAAGGREYTVRPGDSLWSIAAAQLGEGGRYGQIVAANPRVLDGPVSLVQPGWVLRLPETAQSSGEVATVVVQSGDTLTSLAAEHLGDAQRYPEIAAASASTTQPGGVRLSNPDVIDVGWTLTIPAQASAPTADQDQGAPSQNAPAPSPPPPAQTPTATPGAPEPEAEITPAPPAPGDQDGAGRSEISPAPQSAAPTAAPPTASATPGAGAPERAGATSAPPGTAAPVAAERAEAGQQAWPVRTVYGLGAVAATGLLALLLTRRRAQQRRRAPGQVLPATSPAAKRAEADLAVVADALSVTSVDRALRALSAHCAAAGAPLPRVRYARLGATTFTLHLAHPATLPQPWSGTVDASTWTLHTDDTAPDDDLHAGASAPYPTLVTIGHDVDGAHLMLDLEYAGVLDLRGPAGQVHEVAAALAVELATSTWAEQAQITLVGAMPELVDALDTGRLRYLPTPARLLDDLAERARAERAMLAGHGGDLAHARPHPAQAERWAPEVLLIATELTEDQRERLHAIIDTEPALAIAAITSNAGQGAWALHIEPTSSGHDSDSRAVLAPLGIAVAPQRLPAPAYGDLVAAATLTHPDELTDRQVPDAAPTPAPAPAPAPPAAVCAGGGELAWAEVAALLDEQDGAPEDQRPSPVSTSPPPGTPVEVDPQRAPAPDLGYDAPGEGERPGAAAVGEPAPVSPQVLVLGQVVVEGAEGPAEQSKRARLTELAAYIALHPGASAAAVNEAIWPERSGETNSNTRNTAVTKLRRWLGTAPDGAEHLPRHHQDDGYVLHPQVGTDLARWDQLVAGNPLTAPTGNLQRALELVRQRPFHAHHPKRYAWAESITQRLISEIVDAAYELARRQLLAGAWRAAETTLVKGLLIEPAQERLWRMRILAAYEAHDEAAVVEATERLLVITERLECDLEPETTDLLVQIKGPRATFDQLMATAQ